ncbi:Malate dehydrogenase [Candidatus Erwinia haradaeae]|uniref:Malate dehydrogenase n=1 Tax=Candidatus Erwinia haradaeae TaxID=1922217 RepID=A0A451DDI7_9GAMM|nr:malate dehydrogenase [Candidatus Erwinia haradaeae]VFP84476.1 Malate dehydrogenase [Candidatus Erwinia haradaeae]
MKIAILGAAGGIGQSLSLLLKLQLPKNSELSLYDVSSVTPGIAIDLSHIPTSIDVHGFSGNDPALALKDADIVLITAGFARKPGMDRSDLFKLNASIIYTLMEQVAINSPQALIAIITNPVNTTVPIAAEVLKKEKVYNKNKLFGVTTLDVIRANTFVSALIDKTPEELNIPVIGGHSGVTILPLLSQINNGIKLNTTQIHDVTYCVQTAGTKVLEAKSGGGSATLSMAYAATSFCLSLVRALNGENHILEYAYVEGTGEYARFFSQPLILGKNGITEYLSIGILSEFEMCALNNMLDQLKYDIKIGEEFVK